MLNFPTNCERAFEENQDGSNLEDMMSKVLMGVFSVLVLQQTLNRGLLEKLPRGLIAQSNIIENAVLCDKILLESKQSEEWGVNTITDPLPDVFDFVEAGEANKPDESADSAIPHDLPDYQSCNTLAYFSLYHDYSNSSLAFLRRADYYLTLARRLGVYLSLHPIRTNYLRDVLGKRHRQPASKVAVSHFDKRLSSIEAAKYAGVDLTVPPVVDYVVAFAATNQVDLLTAISEIRHSKNAVRFRERCGKVDLELADFSGRPSVLSLQKLIREIDQVAATWEDDLDEGIKYVRRQVSLRKVWGLGRVFEVLGFDQFALKDPVIFSKDGDLLFLNDLYRSPKSPNRKRG